MKIRRTRDFQITYLEVKPAVLADGLTLEKGVTKRSGHTTVFLARRMMCATK